tara:strand:+ start:357 stop:659 length:303 start_codon:yes stop_codon:yes gene_type:complete
MGNKKAIQIRTRSVRFDSETDNAVILGAKLEGGSISRFLRKAVDAYYKMKEQTVGKTTDNKTSDGVAAGQTDETARHDEAGDSTLCENRKADEVSASRNP